MHVRLYRSWRAEHFGSQAIQSARCIRETEGQLSPSYRIVTTKRKGNTKTEYEVNFSFSVGGKEFYGKDTLSDEPMSRSVTVQFNPDDPTQNQEVFALSSSCIDIQQTYLAGQYFLVVRAEFGSLYLQSLLVQRQGLF